ncbi:MAG: DUF5343 domain-containing protein [Afipia sp.]|nr:DUF5343 domain-containing protein [Afipia sp.]
MAGTPLPYLASPGSIKTAFEKIRAAATPDRVTGDFMSTKLQIKGGTGSALIPFLKKIGFVGSDGSPTELYKRFRNPTIGGTAVADAIKLAYAPLKQVNEYFYELPDTELLNLILQVTGLDHDNQVAKLVYSTLKTMKTFADFKESDPDDSHDSKDIVLKPHTAETTQGNSHGGKVGLNLSYTINLNLPATSDQAVFNAIFKSLKEHLLSDE